MSTSPMRPPLHFRTGGMLAAIAPVLAVLVTGVLIGLPFYSSNVIGFEDAVSYQNYAHDVIFQARMGTFPVYVGLTPYTLTGFPVMIWFLFFNGLVVFDILTLHLLPCGLLLNLYMAAFGVLNVLLPYAALLVLAPGHRSFCALLAILFASCPGTLSILYTHDMYPSFAASPFIPVSFVAAFLMVRSFNVRAAMIAACSAAVQWMLHAPTGLFTLYFTMIFVAAAFVIDGERRQLILRNGLVFVSTLFIVGIGYILVVLATDTSAAFNYHEDGGHWLVGQQYVKAAFGVIREWWLGQLLPIDLEDAREKSVQLGYALWALLVIVAVYVATLFLPTRSSSHHRQDRIKLLPFCLCLLVMIALLFPIPGLTRGLLWSLPHCFQIETQWLYQRLYRFMAACIIVAAAVAWGGRHIHEGVLRCDHPEFKLEISARLAVVLLSMILLGWSAFEARKLVDFGWKNASPADTLQDDRIHVLASFFSGIENDQPRHAGHYDPALRLRLITSDGRVRVDSGQRILDKCDGAGSATFQPVHQACREKTCRLGFDGRWQNDRVLTFRVAPGARALLAADLEGAGNLVGKPAQVYVDLDGRRFADQSVRETGRFMVPVENRSDRWKDVAVTIGHDEELALQNICVVPYGEPDLILHPVYGGAGYRVVVDAAKTGEALETTLIYRSGFMASVNGTPAPVWRSPGNLVAVSLDTGRNDVVVTYRAPALVRAAIAFSFIGIAGVLLVSGVRPAGRAPARAALGR